MTRSRIAALLALAFIVLFCFSGVTATTTIDETQAVIQMGMPKLLFLSLIHISEPTRLA